MSHDSEDSDTMMMTIRDWRQALKTPPAYRLGNSTLRIQTKLVGILLIFCVLVIFFLYYTLTAASRNDKFKSKQESNIHSAADCSDICQSLWLEKKSYHYNSTYPISRPKRTKIGHEFRIAVISDLDTDSKSKTESNTWLSYLKKGHLVWNPALSSVEVTWDSGLPIELKSSLSQGGRGMELSELITFNGKLFTVDDRTGIVYELIDNEVVPWVMLSDGNGKVSKGFKSEWAAVKDHNLYIGGLGKEWTDSKGMLLHFNPQWIKIVTQNGEVSHHYWRDNYLALREVVGVKFPGYMIHESAVWSDIHQKWFFLPRRSSTERYHEDTDEIMGTNLIISCDDKFKDCRVTRVGDVVPSHGFSSFKFIPGTEDQIIVAIKSEELKGSVSSYIMAFKINGQILMPETKIGDYKFEGIEFI